MLRELPALCPRAWQGVLRGMPRVAAPGRRCVGLRLRERSETNRVEGLLREGEQMTLKDKNVFISGPITGHDSYMEAFAQAADICEKAGAAFVFNPATAWGHSDRPSEWYMLRDLHRLTECSGNDPLFDVVVQLPGWQYSAGAAAEFRVARTCGIRTMHSRESGTCHPLGHTLSTEEPSSALDSENL